jgi:hypothetical protein
MVNKSLNFQQAKSRAASNGMKRAFLYGLSLLIGLSLAPAAQAICPVCTLAVGAGVGLSRYLGIDDTVTGLWVGGLIVSLIIWTLNWFDKKKIDFLARTIVTVLGYYILIIIPLYYTNIIGHSLNKLLGMDKLLVGIFFGSLLFYLASSWYDYLKRKNNNRPYFPFQKVVMPVSSLIIFSLVFYFITKYN